MLTACPLLYTTDKDCLRHIALRRNTINLQLIKHLDWLRSHCAQLFAAPLPTKEQTAAGKKKRKKKGEDKNDCRVRASQQGWRTARGDITEERQSCQQPDPDENRQQRERNTKPHLNLETHAGKKKGVIIMYVVSGHPQYPINSPCK